MPDSGDVLDEMANFEAKILQKHLTDDELGAYHDDVVDEVDRARTEAHLSRCTFCQRRHSMMAEVLATYTDVPLTVADEAWLQEMLDSTRGEESAEGQPEESIQTYLEQLSAWLDQRIDRFLPVQHAHASTGQQYSDKGYSQDRALSWSIWRKVSGERVLTLVSSRTDLAGQRIAVEVGNLHKEATFQPDPFNQIRTSIEFTPLEIRSVSRHSRTKIYVI